MSPRTRSTRILLLLLEVTACGHWIAQPAFAQEQPAAPASSSIVARHPGSLNLLLTQRELQAFVRNYERETGQNLTSPIEDDEVLVTAPGPAVPMRDISQDAWGGLGAPFWAILNPKDAWRILLPIPPKESSREPERPAPDPR